MLTGYSLGLPTVQERSFKMRFRRAVNVRRWPFPAVQVMKFTGSRPTAAYDPKEPFETERNECPL
jgi:hypothetical protein